MCQKDPGPRCANDTSKGLKSLDRRIGVAKTRVEDTQSRYNEVLFKSGNATNVKEVRAAKRAFDAASKKLEDLQTKRRHTQRDFDGTKTGQRQLEQVVSTTHNEIMKQRYINRKNQGRATYVGRQQALALQEGTIARPMIHFTNEKVGEFA